MAAVLTLGALSAATLYSRSSGPSPPKPLRADPARPGVPDAIEGVWIGPGELSCRDAEWRVEISGENLTVWRGSERYRVRVIDSVRVEGSTAPKYIRLSMNDLQRGRTYMEEFELDSSGDLKVLRSQVRNASGELIRDQVGHDHVMRRCEPAELAHVG